LVLALGLICVANALPADMTVQEAHSVDGLIKPELLKPKIYIQPTVRQNNGTMPPPMPSMDRADSTCGCGYSISNPAAGRIVAGSEVSPVHKLPYQVYLQLCFDAGCALCGGTLLNKRYVLTAMHCVYSSGSWASSIKAVIGEHNIEQDWETSADEQSIQVEDIISRSDYNENTIENDIAILKLSQDVTFSDYVVPACLPSSSSNSYTGQSATVSGWGTTSEGGDTSAFLKETSVNVVSATDSTCSGYGIDDTLQMCAYAAGTDSCQGDSGGPLVLNDGGKNTVIGVVSYGMGCARDGVAGVYAKVTGYLDWVTSNIADGWCDGTETTTTTTAAPAAGTACDLSCYFTITGTYYINGHQAACVSGVCTATDGSDLCASLGTSGC